MGVTSIEWCDYTFNPWWGCTKVSPGCKNCYAEDLDKIYSSGDHWGPGKPRRTMSDAYWKKPLTWERLAAADADGVPPRVFCASMADVFDDEAPRYQLARLWQLIEETPHLDWLLLTKRTDRMRSFFTQAWPNVWLGTSVENQQRADERIPELLATPATVRFLSCEPLLGPVDLHLPQVVDDETVLLNWVIAGGESGPRARPMDLAWARSLRQQCDQASVPFFMKQLGSPPSHYDPARQLVAADGPDWLRVRESHGRRMAEWPEDLRVREWPLIRSRIPESA